MKGVASSRREATVDENLARFAEMRTGSTEGQRWCLRAKISFTDPNKAMRDPVIYRCNVEPHHRTGCAREFRIWLPPVTEHAAQLAMEGLSDVRFCLSGRGALALLLVNHVCQRRRTGLARGRHSRAANERIPRSQSAIRMDAEGSWRSLRPHLGFRVRPIPTTSTPPLLKPRTAGSTLSTLCYRSENSRLWRKRRRCSTINLNPSSEDGTTLVSLPFEVRVPHLHVGRGVKI